MPKVILLISIVMLLNLNLLPLVGSLFALQEKNDKQVNAQEIVSVNVLRDVYATGGNVRRTEFNPTFFELQMSSLGLLEVDVLAPTLKTQFQADEFKNQIVEGGNAEITLNILPLTRDNLPSLYIAIEDILVNVTSLTVQVGGLISELTNIIPGVLQVQGLDDVITALTALENLDEALASVTSYTQLVNSNVDNPNGILTVEYGDGLGQHLENMINDVVSVLLNNLSTALSNLSIALLPGGINLSNVMNIVRKLDELPILGPVLGPILSLLGSLLPILVLGPVTDTINDLIASLLVTAGSLSTTTTNLTETLMTDVLVITDGLVALQLIGGAEVSLTDIQVSETVTGIVDVRALAVDEPVIEVDIFQAQGAIAPVDFGSYSEVLAFVSVPEVIPFQSTPINGEFVKIPRTETEFNIVVEDTRRLNRYFRVMAEINTPLASENGNHQLPNALVLVDENDEIHPLSSTPVEAFSRPDGEENTITISWPLDQGPMIYVNTKDVFATSYSTTITWTLVDAP